MSRARRSTRRFRQSIRSTTRVVRSFAKQLIALSGIGTIYGLSYLVGRELKALRVVSDVSDKLGMQTDKLVGMQYAARLAGMEINQTNMALQRFFRRVGEAAKGMGEAQQVLKTLGLDAKSLGGMLPIEQMYALAEAFENATGSNEELRRAFKLFDSEGVGMINVLRLGKKGLKELVDEAKLLGFALSPEDMEQIVRVTDSIRRTGFIIRGAVGRIAVALAPVIENVTRAFGEMVAKMNAGSLRDFIKVFLVGSPGTLQVGFVTILGEIADQFRIYIPQGIARTSKALLDFGIHALNVLNKVLNPLAALGGTNIFADEIKGLSKSSAGMAAWDLALGGKEKKSQAWTDAIAKWFAAPEGGPRKNIRQLLAGFMDMAGGGASGSQLMGAQALGIVGNRPRFGAAGGASMPQDIHATALNTSEMKVMTAKLLGYMKKWDSRTVLGFGVSIRQ